MILFIQEKHQVKLVSSNTTGFFFQKEFHHNQILELCNRGFFVVFDFIENIFTLSLFDFLFSNIICYTLITIFVPLLQNQENFCKVPALVITYHYGL